ncbi:MAG: DegV family protein [Anaerolineae bacterium]|jgi:DegV family protein with EDD domain|nr:DegV family protein [Anaerolineae bacterium]MRS03387.1 DegV family protein [bacterium]
MTKIAILTDSTANLPVEWVEQYNVRVIPLKIHWGNETFLDGVGITPNEFYTRLSHSKSLPTTSQPSIQDFLQAFESLADQADGIVVPLISSGISGTVASAQAATRQFNRVPVEIVDTRVTSAGQALVVMAAARAAAQGKSLQDVRQAADGVVQRMHLFFAVDTLEYLHRGGRIGGASRYLGTVLNIKPILYFDLDGKLDALERARTKGKALQRLMALAEEKANGHPLRIGVIHANAPQIAQEFCEQITHHLDCKEVITLELSPAIGVHVGPGTIGIALYTED